METGSIQGAIVGAFFTLAGILMIVFRQDLVDFEELPEVLRTFQPHGRLRIVFIIVFGALSLLGGLTVLIVNLD